MDNFTPVSGFLGGILIGSGASLLILLSGRVAGISGIYGGLLAPKRTDWLWRAAFVVGIVLGAIVVRLLGGGPVAVSIEGSWPVLVVAGLLVGYGVRLGNGCTSGHGVCGIARGSGRSLAATAIFFATAVVTVYLARQIGG